MPSETIHCDATVNFPAAYTLVGAATANEALADSSNSSYVSGTDFDEGDILKLGLPLPSLPDPILTVTATVTLKVAGSTSGWPLVPLAIEWREPDSTVLHDAEGNVLSFGFTPLAGNSIETLTSSRTINLTAAEIAAAEAWVVFRDTDDLVTLYEVKFEITTSQGLGYDDPPPPIPEVLLSPPRRRFVFPIT